MENRIYENPIEDKKHINEPITYYHPQSSLERWVVAIACAIFFPLVYLIGRVVKYLLN